MKAVEDDWRHTVWEVRVDLWNIIAEEFIRRGHSVYGDEKGMKVAPCPSQMIHSLPWPLVPGLTSLLFALLAVYCRAPLWGELKCMRFIAKHTGEPCVCKYKGMQACQHAYVCFIHGCTLIKHICKCQKFTAAPCSHLMWQITSSSGCIVLIPLVGSGMEI